MEFDFSSMLEEICMDVKNEREIREISSAFHETLVQAIMECLINLRKRHPSYSNRVVLSGGSFHNRYLKKRLVSELKKMVLLVLHTKRCHVTMEVYLTVS